MHTWIDYYDSTHTIYVSPRHRDLHFSVIAEDIIRHIPSPGAVVLDYACGEALFAGRIADACAKLILAEPAPGVRGRLTARFADDPRITVRSLDELADLPPASLDLAVMNSVAQYMTPKQFDTALAIIVRALKPSGQLLLGDILKPQVGVLADVRALLTFARRNGFLKDALRGLISTARSDYRKLRTDFGLQRYSEAEIIEKLRAHGYSARRAPENIGYNPYRMSFIAVPDAAKH